MKKGAERRRSPRYAIEQMVQVSGMKEEFLNATSINISEHGLSCTCEERVEPTGTLFLMLRLGGNRTIKVESVVVWTKKKGAKYELGIEFTNMPSADAKTLRNFLGAH